MPQRRSGLSEPYLAIASAYGMRRNGRGASRPINAINRSISGSTVLKIRSSVANDISRSTCVNSG